MGEVVNLRQARKRAERAAKETVADANRVEFGTSRMLKAQARQVRERAKAKLDGHRIEAGEAPFEDKS